MTKPDKEVIVEQKAHVNEDAVLLTVKQVARLANCSTRHIRRLTDRGAMPRPVRLGHLIRWRRYEVQQWIDAGCPSGRAAERRCN